MNGHGGGVGELAEGVLLEEAQRVREHGDGGQRVGPVGRRDHGAPAQRLLVVQRHLELVEVEPLARLPRRQVVVEVPGRVAERVELARRSQQEHGRRLGVRDARVAAWTREHGQEEIVCSLARDGARDGARDEAERRPKNGLLTFPFAHHVHLFRVVDEAERVARVGRAEVDRLERTAT